MFNKLKTALVLVIIGAVSGFLIYEMNELTFDTIQQKRQEQEEGFYKEIFELDEEAVITFKTDDFTVTVEDTEVLMTEIVIKDSNDAVIGYIYKGSETNNYGDITVLVGVNTDGSIADVIISQTTNTSTFVKTIKDDYLPKFDGQSSDTVTYDVRTGASYTYGSVSKFVKGGLMQFDTERGESNE